MVVTSTTLYSQYVTVTDLHEVDWSSIKEELSSMILPNHVEFTNIIISPREAADEFTTLIKDHLDHHLCLERHKQDCFSP